MYSLLMIRCAYPNVCSLHVTLVGKAETFRFKLLFIVLHMYMLKINSLLMIRCVYPIINQHVCPLNVTMAAKVKPYTHEMEDVGLLYYHTLIDAFSVCRYMHCSEYPNAPLAVQGSHSHTEVAVNWEEETFPLLQRHQSPNAEGFVDEFTVVSISCYGHCLHNEESDYSLQHFSVGQVNGHLSKITSIIIIIIL